MPSVIVGWSGQCADPAVRAALCRDLGEVADLSHGFFDAPRPLYTFFDHTIENRTILLDGALLEPGDEASYILPAVYRHPPGEAAGGIELRRAGPQPKVVRVTDDLYSVPSVHLYGIEFRLYDGRGLYPDDDRISFVFATVPGCAELQGRLVYAEDQRQCRTYQHPAVQEADWFLTAPHLHLRYYCEEWMDCLLGFIKYFYLPGLYYERYEPLSGYAALKARLDRLDPDRGKVLALEALKGGLRKEVEEWQGTAAYARAFWAATRSGQ